MHACVKKESSSLPFFERSSLIVYTETTNNSERYHIVPSCVLCEHQTKNRSKEYILLLSRYIIVLVIIVLRAVVLARPFTGRSMHFYYAVLFDFL